MVNIIFDGIRPYPPVLASSRVRSFKYSMEFDFASIAEISERLLSKILGVPCHHPCFAHGPGFLQQSSAQGHFGFRCNPSRTILFR